MFSHSNIRNGWVFSSLYWIMAGAVQSYTHQLPILPTPQTDNRNRCRFPALYRLPADPAIPFGRLPYMDWRWFARDQSEMAYFHRHHLRKPFRCKNDAVFFRWLSVFFSFVYLLLSIPVPIFCVIPDVWTYPAWCKNRLDLSDFKAKSILKC